MDKWSNLSMRDRSNLIKIYMQNGIKKSQQMRDHYNQMANGGDLKQQSLHMNVDGEYWNLHQTHYDTPYIWNDQVKANGGQLSQQNAFVPFNTPYWNLQADGGDLSQQHANVRSGTTWWNYADGGNLFGEAGQIDYLSRNQPIDYNPLTVPTFTPYQQQNVSIPKVNNNIEIEQRDNISTGALPLSPLTLYDKEKLVDYNKAALPMITQNLMPNIKANDNFAVVDKGVDSIYYFNKDKQLIRREPVIVGADNGGKDTFLSMKDYLQQHGGTHEDYFNYLEKNKGRITPTGIFQISGLRENTATNPDKIGNLINTILPFRWDNKDMIRSHRLRDYGSQEQLFTLINEKGVGSSKAIHGTDNPDREEVFNNPNAKNCDRNMSNGCINVKDDSQAFDLLNKGNKVVIADNNLDNKSQLDLTKDYNFSSNNTYLDRYKKRVKAVLSNADDEAIDFISSIAQKESEAGRGIKRKIENFAPSFISHSKGDFQINPKSFAEYLPIDYSGKFEDQVQAVYNFYNKHKDTLTPKEMYSLYNSGFIQSNNQQVKKNVKQFGKIISRITDL